MPLLLVFFFSGASGLIYQVIWVRQFGNVFGSTVHSASLVTAIFMLGLGLGSYLGGRLADARIARDPSWPLLAYARLEIAIGVLSAAVAFSLPNLGALSASMSEYVAGPDGWSRLSKGAELIRYGVAIALLSPITLLMGATLTILIRHLVRADLAGAGRQVAVLYGANTTGAAAGCLITDFVLVPSLGLFATQMFAVCLNLGAGLAAFWLARRTEPGGVPPAERDEALDRPLVFTSIAIALTGFASMGMEILWFRQLSAMLRSQRNVFSLLLAVLLIGTALGASLAPRIERRFRPNHAFAVSVLIYVIAALLGFATLQNHDLVEIDRLFRQNMQLSPLEWKLQEFSSLMTPFLQVVLVPTLAVGATYPLANAYVQRAATDVGRRAGALYLANTIGAVAGALTAGFVLLPAFGVQLAAAVLMGCMAASVVALAAVTERRRIMLASFGGIALTIASYLALPADHMARRLIPERFANQKVLAIHEGVSESIAVIESSSGDRRLLTNGFSMSGTALGGQRYMRLFVHFPLLQIESPENVLVVAFGVGNTAQAALHHPVRRIDVVDLSEDILKLSPLFSATNGDVLRDPRVHVFVNDGRQHLRMTPPETYDLITSEPPPLMNAGVVALYSVEYYELARSRLKPGGWMTQWLPIYQLDEDVARSVVRSFLDVFPATVLLSGWSNELILAGYAGDRIEIDPDAIVRALLDRPATAADLARVDIRSAGELIGSIVGPTSALHRATRNVLPVTDDWPIMEYESVLFAPTQRTPSELYAPLDLRENCPRCFEGDRVRDDLRILAAYMEVHDAYLASSAFLEPYAPRSRYRRYVPPRSDVVTESLPESAYLRLFVH